MKKRILIVLLTCATILSGCGATTEEPQEVESITEEEDDEEEKEEESEVEESTEAAEVDLSTAIPEFALTTNYISEYVTDADGNSDYFSPQLLHGLSESMILTDESKDLYPALAENFESEIKSMDEETKQQQEELLAKSQTQRASEDNSPTYYLSRNYYLQRVDHHYASFLVENTIYEGGAHGTTDFTGMVFDVSTGKRLELEDVITDMKKFKSALGEQIAETTGALARFTGEGEFDWYLDVDGISVILNAGKFLDYAAGPQIFTLPYDAPYVNQDVALEEGRGYVSKLPIRFIGTPHVDSVDTWKGLTVAPTFPEDYDEQDPYIEDLNINYNNASYQIQDLYNWAYNVYRIQTADGNLFAVVRTVGDSDWITEYVLDLKEGSIRQTTEESFDTALYGPENMYNILLADPDHMLLASRMDIMSSYHAFKAYRFTSEGKFESDDKYFMAKAYNPLTTIADTPGTLVDEEGNELEPATIPAGSECVIYRTDGDKLVDFKLDDGRLIRITVEPSPDGYISEPYIQGQPATDFFEMLYFAG